MNLLLEGVLAFCLLPTLAFVPSSLTTTTGRSNHPSCHPLNDKCWQHLQKLDSNTVPGFRINNSNSNNNNNMRETSICYMARNTDTTKRKRPATKTKKRGRKGLTKWDIMIPRLEAFNKANGHSLVTDKDDDIELYKWTRQLRYNFIHQIRNTTTPVGRRYRRFLSNEQLERLESLDFVWETQPKKKASQHASWDHMIGRLERFQQKHGHTKVTNEDDSKLFNWCKYIRYSYGHQIESSLTNSTRTTLPRLAKGKLKQLQEIGFDWGTRRKVRQWDVMFPRLTSFHVAHGHVNVTPTDDLELYQWVNRMRYNYQHQALNITTTARRPRLAKAKLATLNEMGFIWQSNSTSPEKPKATWEDRYQELCDFKKKHGHCYVSSTENKPLYVFCNKQREEFRKYKVGNFTSMTEKRIRLLSKIQFEWIKPHDRTWEERRAELEDYWQRTGDPHVPQDYNSNFQLGQWCMNQRSFHRMNKNGDQTGLTSERVRKLEKLEFPWSYRRLRWYSMFQRLKKYAEEHGDLEISTKDVDNRDLRQWINEQRFFYRTGQTNRMTEERKELLDSIPSFSWERKRATGPSKHEWNKLFVAIKEKGISPEGKAKQHWFDGQNRFEQEVKTQYNEDELMALWNEETEDDEAEDEDGDEFYEDEDSTLFLRA
ncbi:unnamed protein product [Cylindrotheca closterium]|uniref:Helicase-associated domain-containing protein n=1 Tax=Cylindrotheca closterium TaxID=2856 RepID=A0AAD2FBM6_9STRA|nr:unnamed protein product [Cylindrotheca closterium]